MRTDMFAIFTRKTEVTPLGINKSNSEGYYDPTAYEALTAIVAEAKKRSYRPMIYVCSPLSGDVEQNQENARRYCRFVVDSGGIPVAPHIFLPQFMNDDDPAERDLALFMDIVFLSKCEELWVFGKRISHGMSIEIERAKRKNQKIRYFSEDCEEAKS